MTVTFFSSIGHVHLGPEWNCSDKRGEIGHCHLTTFTTLAPKNKSPCFLQNRDQLVDKNICNLS